MSSEETLKFLDTNKSSSFIRFGDGELFMVLRKNGYNIGYQKWSPELAKRIKDVISCTDEDVLICLPYPFSKKFVNLNANANKFWSRHVYETLPLISNILNLEKTYGDSLISRPYIDLEDKSKATEIFTAFRKLWTDANIVLIEGEHTRFGVNNDLLSNATSVTRILVPAENAFDAYDQILDAALDEPKDSIYLLAVGPTAKVLALDLHRSGRRCFDVGHLDIEYEWYLRGAKKKVLIPGKYVNEHRKKTFEECTEIINDKFLNEIRTIIKKTN